MKHQGIVIAIIACIGLLLFAVIFTNNQAKLALERDAVFQQKEDLKRSNLLKCIQLSTAKIEQDACSFYRMPYPCIVPAVGQKGLNESITYATNLCQKLLSN